MAIIDADGMFLGDRMRLIRTDVARLWWPWFYCYSNGYGRFEVNYHRIVSRMLATFSEIPREDEIIDWLQQYNEAHLLFLYQSDGQVWGQWDTSERYLPRHKTRADEASPTPPEPDFSQWRAEYGKMRQKHAISNLCNVFGNSAQNFQKDVRGIGVGIGVGVGGGEGVGDGEEASVCLPDRKIPERPPTMRSLLEAENGLREFRAAYERLATASPSDWGVAASIWRSLDFEQREAAQRCISEWQDPQFLPLPQNFLSNRVWMRVRKRAEPKSRVQELIAAAVERR